MFTYVKKMYEKVPDKLWLKFTSMEWYVNMSMYYFYNNTFSEIKNVI